MGREGEIEAGRRGIQTKRGERKGDREIWKGI
jgi:hypothetical protein